MLQAHPAVEKPLSKQRRVEQSREHNLLRRLNEKKTEFIAFLHDPSLPFDNNQAEHNLRMMKVQQKVSTCFRNEYEVKVFCVIRSDLSTACALLWPSVTPWPYLDAPSPWPRVLNR